MKKLISILVLLVVIGGMFIGCEKEEPLTEYIYSHSSDTLYIGDRDTIIIDSSYVPQPGFLGGWSLYKYEHYVDDVIENTYLSSTWKLIFGQDSVTQELDDATYKFRVSYTFILSDSVVVINYGKVTNVLNLYGGDVYSYIRYNVMYDKETNGYILSSTQAVTFPSKESTYKDVWYLRKF